jgi:hypothetical protein
LAPEKRFRVKIFPATSRSELLTVAERMAWRFSRRRMIKILKQLGKSCGAGRTELGNLAEVVAFCEADRAEVEKRS